MSKLHSWLKPPRTLQLTANLMQSVREEKKTQELIIVLNEIKNRCLKWLDGDKIFDKDGLRS